MQVEQHYLIEKCVIFIKQYTFNYKSIFLSSYFTILV